MKRTLKKYLGKKSLNLLRKQWNYYIMFLNFLSNGPKSRQSTSLSDNQIYPNFCNKASINLSVFANFRRNKIYQQILEHVDYKLGQDYLNEILKNNSEFLKEIEQFKENDKWGNPRVYNYPSVGKISPSTLRYIKVYSDLVYLFNNNLDGNDICEIGVGYGGQCRIIHSIDTPSSYTLVDIKPALRLSQTYLDNYILKTEIRFKTMNELSVQDYDLVISNYAFTELPRIIQDEYLKKVILKSKKGYITYNDIVPHSFNSYKKEELVELIPNSKILEEKPLTHKNNCIIIWQ
jgi:putative sugar O-methyltransferase